MKHSRSEDPEAIRRRISRPRRLGADDGRFWVLVDLLGTVLGLVHWYFSLPNKTIAMAILLILNYSYFLYGWKIGSWELLVVTSDILQSFSVGLSWIVFLKNHLRRLYPKGRFGSGGVSGPSGCNRGIPGLGGNYLGKNPPFVTNIFLLPEK